MRRWPAGPDEGAHAQGGSQTERPTAKSHCSIGKAERGPAAIESIRRHGAATLIAIGGAATLVSKAVKSARVLAFADLGMEAIHEFVVADMLVTVAVDATGASVHQTGPSQWRRPVVRRVVAGVGS